MRALYQDIYGDLSSFKLGDLAVPVPGPSEVLIRVYAAALNPIDIGRSYLIKDEVFSAVTGYDVAGVIESVGPSVTAFVPGDRVFGDVQGSSLGPKESGSIAEFCTSKVHLLARIPDGATFVEAAALPVVACTAIQLFEMAGLKAGDKVFISGGAGGVGIHAIQIAKALFGASEVATTASALKKDLVVMYRADKVVDYKSEDAGEMLKGWADVVMDTTAEIDMEKKVLKSSGALVSIAEFGRADVTSLSLQPGQELIEKTAKLLEGGKLKAVVDTVYSLEEALKAVEHIAGGRAKGKVIVQVQEE